MRFSVGLEMPGVILRTLPKGRAAWLSFALFVAVCGVFVWEVWGAPPFAVDDAYITFSFSKNLARGLGPIYGNGVRVEGYSNFLWMVVVAVELVFAKATDPLVLARIATVPFVVVLFASTYGLVKTRANAVIAIGAALVLAVSTNVVLAFESGLETIPYVALTTTGFLLYVRGLDSPRAKRWSVVVLGAAALTRVDGFIPLGYVLVVEKVAAWTERRLDVRAYVKWALPGVVPWVAWFVWQWAYYGLPLPATYYAKALIPELLPRHGAEYVMDEVASAGLYLALPAYAFLLWRRHRPAAIAGTFALVQLAYAARVGGDWMPSGRFVLPAVPLLIALIAWALVELRSVVAERALPVRLAVSAAGVATFAFLVEKAEPHLSDDPYVRGKLALAADQTRHVASLKEAASYLSLVVPPHGRLVTDYGGVMAYYTEAAPIEMWGLCNAMIALRGSTAGVNPIYGKTCPACYPELHPEYFHTMQPLVRRPNAFRNHADVVRAVWQTDAIGRYMDIVHGFVSGRIVDARRGRAVWFLERRRPGESFHARTVGAALRIEYPFVPGGTEE